MRYKINYSAGALHRPRRIKSCKIDKKECYIRIKICKTDKKRVLYSYKKLQNRQKKSIMYYNIIILNNRLSQIITIRDGNRSFIKCNAEKNPMKCQGLEKPAFHGILFF